MEEFDKQLLLANKILLKAPNRDGFKMSQVILQLDLEEEDKVYLSKYSSSVINLLDTTFRYIDRPMTFGMEEPYCHLTDLGREVKAKGGHEKYHADLEAKAQKQKEREEFEDLTKKWLYKSRWFPLFFSALALIVSVMVYMQKNREIEIKKKSDKSLKNDTTFILKVDSAKK